jgi:hypothetical protein
MTVAVAAAKSFLIFYSLAVTLSLRMRLRTNVFLELLFLGIVAIML